MALNFCPNCGAPLTIRIPSGDSVPRHVCDACHTVHYQNPKLVVGCIPTWKDRILLCRRAIEPRHGFWTIPAGFMENGETTAEAAQRETLEEACARVAIGPLYALYNLPHYNQVYLIFLARMTDPGFAPGEESLEVRLFHPRDIPWDELAFQAVRHTLTRFTQEGDETEHRFHIGDIHPAPDGGHTITFRPQ